MRKAAPRLVIAGTGSGCGKTTVTCALLRALVRRGEEAAAFKCGPDYIDPMFHREVVGAGGANLDLFFQGETGARRVFLRRTRPLNVIEGVMGYYDGIAMDSDRASSYHLAGVLDAPAVLVMNGRGMALSAAALVRGFLGMRTPSRIAGVILSRVSPAAYPRLRAVIERESGAKVYGYLPDIPEARLESRRLGLVTAEEVAGLKQALDVLAARAEETLDINGLTSLMRAQAPLEEADQSLPYVGPARIAVARDEAFCFYYPETFDLLREMGAELLFFSPLRDRALPPCDGLLLGGGYPELHAGALAANHSMREAIRRAVQGGVPTIAECGGFMYLTERIGEAPMAGALAGGCRDTGRLARFGYATLRAEKGSLLFAPGDTMPAHEFHYWDADDPGADLTARKASGREYPSAHASPTLYAGFPHLYLPARPEAAARFLKTCLERRGAHETA